MREHRGSDERIIFSVVEVQYLFVQTKYRERFGFFITSKPLTVLYPRRRVVVQWSAGARGTRTGGRSRRKRPSTSIVVEIPPRRVVESPPRRVVVVENPPAHPRITPSRDPHSRITAVKLPLPQRLPMSATAVKLPLPQRLVPMSSASPDVLSAQSVPQRLPMSSQRRPPPSSPLETPPWEY